MRQLDLYSEMVTKFVLQYFNRTILSDVPEEDLKYYGGSVETLDYCPFPKGFDWADKGGIIDRDSKCTVVNNTARRLF